MNKAMTKARKQLIGRVTGNRMDKTITVLIRRRVKHPLYGKVITRSTKLHVHDENNECEVGDMVAIVSCSPKSKTKAWVLDNILDKGTAEKV